MSYFSTIKILDSSDEYIDVQNLFPTDSDSIYAKDADVSGSSIGDFTGVITDIFDDLDTTITATADQSSGLAIAKGDVAGSTFIHKFGNAPDFNTADGEVDIWDGADDSGSNLMTYTFSSTADIDSLSSSDNGDTQDIEVQGLDSSYNLVTQTITLTGQTRKALDTDLIRVFRLKNVGTTDLAGTVYCFVNVETTGGVPNTLANIRAQVDNGNNQTLMAIYTVPAGKTGYMRNWYASTAGANKSSNYVIRMKARPFGQVFQTKHLSAIADDGSSTALHTYIEPEVFAEKTDIVMSAQMKAVGGTLASVSAGFDIVLVDD